MSVVIIIIGCIDLILAIVSFVFGQWIPGVAAILSAICVIYVGFKCREVNELEKELDELDERVIELEKKINGLKTNSPLNSNIKQQVASPKTEGWICPRCGHNNPSSLNKCENCFKDRD